MVDIHAYQDPNGYRTSITYGRKTIVIDGFFGDKAIHTGEYSTTYLYGT